MDFRLIIDKSCNEQITATVHERTALIDEIEELVIRHGCTHQLAGFTEDEIRMLEFSQIDCIFVESSKTFAATVDGKVYRLRMRLYEAEALLTAGFVRLNKSALGNMDNLEKFTTTLTGAVDAVFKGGHKEYVSRRCFAEIKRRLMK